jgi:hypothetical protein
MEEHGHHETKQPTVKLIFPFLPCIRPVVRNWSPSAAAGISVTKFHKEVSENDDHKTSDRNEEHKMVACTG